MQSFYSHGKLLLTGEYVVLDGAIALAVPTKFGQSLNVNTIEEKELHWKSLDLNGNIWFKDELSLVNLNLESSNPNNEISKRLIQILNAARKLNKSFLKDELGFEIITELEFPNSWGLGTSSTLINNVANWAKVDAYKLLNMTFGGSGYDIACAQHESAITYQLSTSKREISEINYKPDFADKLFFIHLNKKQDSRKGIKIYKDNKTDSPKSISKINNITEQLLKCQSLKKFEALLNEHEHIISELIGIKPIKQDLFKDYKGAMKSLGAWGGDFILVTGTLNDMSYFKNKGYHTIINYNDMAL